MDSPLSQLPSEEGEVEDLYRGSYARNEKWLEEATDEFLDVEKSHSAWRNGPSLPFPMEMGAMVAYKNALILVSGSVDNKVVDRSCTRPNYPGVEGQEEGHLYKLIATDSSARWYKMHKKMKHGRMRHVAFLIPDHYVTCV